MGTLSLAQGCIGPEENKRGQGEEDATCDEACSTVLTTGWLACIRGSSGSGDE